MKKLLIQALTILKRNKIALIMGMATMIVVAVPAYAYQAKQENNKQKTNQVKQIAFDKKAQETKKTQEVGSAPVETPKPIGSTPVTSKPNTSKYIKISAGAVKTYENTAKIPISWSASFVSEKGYKLVWSKSPNPVYPGSNYGYYGNKATSGTGYVTNNLGAGTYYVRVCEYLGGSCGVYSNQITVNMPEIATPPPVVINKTINLSLDAVVSGSAKFSWNASFASEKGYKFVWSVNPNPVYPGSDYQYFGGTATSGYAYITTPGTYYVRVCEYLGGSCGVYSNQVLVTIP